MNIENFSKLKNKAKKTDLKNSPFYKFYLKDGMYNIVNMVAYCMYKFNKCDYLLSKNYDKDSKKLSKWQEDETLEPKISAYYERAFDFVSYFIDAQINQFLKKNNISDYKTLADCKNNNELRLQECKKSSSFCNSFFKEFFINFIVWLILAILSIVIHKKFINIF